jgi:hypothetical protein
MDDENLKATKSAYRDVIEIMGVRQAHSVISMAILEWSKENYGAVVRNEEDDYTFSVTTDGVSFSNNGNPPLRLPLTEAMAELEQIEVEANPGPS